MFIALDCRVILSEFGLVALLLYSLSDKYPWEEYGSSYLWVFDWPYAGVHRGTSLTISSLLLQQCPAYLVRLAGIVFVIGGR